MHLDIIYQNFMKFSLFLNSYSRKWRICNPYSKFATMTKFRWEIIIEGKEGEIVRERERHNQGEKERERDRGWERREGEDLDSTSEINFLGSMDGRSWKEYEFKYKPSRPDKRPPCVPGYMPSLDWQLWFVPLGGYPLPPPLGISCPAKFHLADSSQFAFRSSLPLPISLSALRPVFTPLSSAFAPSFFAFQISLVSLSVTLSQIFHAGDA
jgi:hypothetical protein